MESTPPAQSILDTLRTVEFRLGLKGYNVDEVDEYLEKAAVEAEALQEQLRQMAERLRQASERIGQIETERRDAPPPAERAGPGEAVSDDTLKRTLVLAQRFVDQTKRESEAEAAKIVAQAEEHARSTIAQADEEARRRTTDAEQRSREDVARLEAIRGQLAGEVDAMGRHLESERVRIRAALTEVLKWFDENVQPEKGLPGPRSRQPGMEAPPSPVAPVNPAAAALGGAGQSEEVDRQGAPRSPSAPALSGGSEAGSGDGDKAPAPQVLDLRGAASGAHSALEG